MYTGTLIDMLTQQVSTAELVFLFIYCVCTVILKINIMLSIRDHIVFSEWNLKAEETQFDQHNFVFSVKFRTLFLSLSPPLSFYTYIFFLTSSIFLYSPEKSNFFFPFLCTHPENSGTRWEEAGSERKEGSGSHLQTPGCHKGTTELPYQTHFTMQTCLVQNRSREVVNKEAV